MIRRRIAEIIGTELTHHAPAGIDQITPVLEWIAEPTSTGRNMPRSHADQRMQNFMLRGNARANWA
jgi:hypothetical protein